MSRLLPLLLLLLGAARGTETSKLQRTVGAGAGTPKASGTAMPTSPSDSETFNAVEASESQRVLKPERTIPSPLAPSRTMKGSRMAAMVEGSHLYGKRTRKPVHGSPGEAPTEMASILVSNEPVSLPVRREATGTLKRTSQHTRVSSQPSKMAPSLAKPPTNETIQQARRASAARKPQGVSTKPLKEACTQPHCTRAPSIPGNPSRVPAAASSTHRPVAMVTGSQRRDSDSSEQTHQSGSEGNVLHKRGNGFREPGRAARLYVANGGGTASGDPGSQRVQTVPGRSRPPGNKLPAAPAPPASPPPSSSEDSLARSSVTRESTRPVGMATGASKSKTFTEQKASESARTRGPKANFSAMGLRLQPGKLRVLAPTGVTMPTTGVPTGPARLGSLQAVPFTGARTANTIPTSKDTTASQGQAGLRRTLTPSVSGHPRTSSLASNSVSKEGTPKAFSTVRTSGPSRISGLVDQFQGQSARAPHYPLSAFPESVLGSVAGNLSLLNKRDFASLSTWELVTTDYQPAIKLTAQAKKPPTVKITPAKQATLRSTTSVGSSRLPPQSTPEISSARKLAALPIHSSQVPTTQANQKTTSRYHFLSEPNTLVNQIAPALTTETYLSPDRRTSAHHSPQKLTALANQRPPKLTIPVNPRPRELTTTANQIPPELTTPETPFSPDTTIAGDSPVTKLYTLVDSFPSSPSKSVLSTSPLTKKRPNHSPTKPNAPKNHPLSERIPPSGHTLPEPAMPANQLLSILPIQENHYLKKLTTPANLSTQQATPTQQVSTPAALSSPELPTPSTYSLPELTTPSKNSTVKHGKVAEHATPDLTLQVNRFTSELNTPANHYLPEQAETLSEPAFPSDQTALENLFTARSTPETKRLTEPIISSNTAPRQLTRAEDQSSTESSTQAELSKAYVQDLNTLARKFIPKQNPKTANPPVELSVTENQTQLYLITHLRPQPAKQTVPTHLLSSDWTAPVSQISQEKLTYERGSHLQTTAPPLYRTREKQFTPNKRPLEQMSTVDHFLKEITTPVYHLPPGLFTSSRKPSQRLTQAQQILSDLTTREIHALPELTTPTYHNTPELTTIVGRTASELTAPDHTLSELDISAGPTTSELTTEKGHTASEITTHMIYNAADLTTPIGNTALRSATPASDTTSKLRTSVDHTTTLLSTSVDHTISEITIPVDHTRSELTAVVDHPALRPTTPAGPTTSKLITSVSDTTSKLTTTAPHTTMKLTTPVRHTTFERTMPTGHTESKITTPVDLTTSKVVTLVDHTTLKATTAAFGQTSNLDISVSETPPDVTTPIFHPQSTIPYGTGSETPHVSTEKRSPFVPANNEHSGVTQWTVPHHTSKNHTLPNQTTETPEISSSWYVTSTGTTRRTQTAGEFISWQASTSSPTGGTKVQQATTRHDSSTGHAEGPKLAAEPSFWPTVTSGQTEVSKVPGHVNLWYTPTADRTESSELPKESDSHYKSSAFPTADAKVTRPWYAQSPYPTGGSDVSNESSSWQSVSSPTVKPSGKTLNVPEIFTSTAKNGTSSSGIFVPGEASTLPTPSGGQSGITNFEMTTNSIRMKSTVIHHQFPTTSPVNTHPHPTHRTSLSTSHHSTSRGVPERAGRIFIVEDQPPILKASEVDVAFQLALDMVYIRNLERVDSLQRQDLVHAFQETVSPFYKSVPGFVRLEVLGFREGSVILDYIAVFNLESVNLLMMEQPERLLNLSRLPLAITSGLWVAGHRVMGVSVTERWADLCGKAYSCLAGFVCAHARNGNITCTSLCHDGFCKNEGICTHRRGQEPMCQCPVGSDYWFMGERCDYRMTQQALLGISCGVILSLILCISAIAYLAMRRFKALLVETKINQTKSSYRRFSRFDDISTRYWSHSQSQSWLGASISSLDNLAFSHSEEVLHLHAMESRRGSSPEDADPAGTCSPRSTPHRRPECRPGFHSDWETSCSSFNDPMVDSGKASAISVSSWPMEPIQWTPFPILHQLTAHSPYRTRRPHSYCEGMELVNMERSWTA